jgi:hypothetical protein
MKVLQPTNTTHSITIIPRAFPTGALNLKIVKEGVNTFATSTPTYTIANGLLILTFALVGLEGEKFTIKLTQGTTVVYRCKLFFTAQTPQEYKQTKNLYIYA